VPTKISQRNVATSLTRDRVRNDHFMTNLLHSLKAKELWNSIVYTGSSTMAYL